MVAAATAAVAAAAVALVALAFVPLRVSSGSTVTAEGAAAGAWMDGAAWVEPAADA